MPTATYREFRVVLQRSGFRLVRSKKHETWEKTLDTGEILQVRLSHRMRRDIPTPLFHLMLRQARLTQPEFAAVLRKGEGGPTHRNPSRMRSTVSGVRSPS